MTSPQPSSVRQAPTLAAPEGSGRLGSPPAVEEPVRMAPQAEPPRTPVFPDIGSSGVIDGGSAADPRPRSSAAKAIEAVVRARVWLSRGVEPGSTLVYRYVERVGPVAAVQRIRAGTAPAELDQPTVARRHQDEVAADLARAAQAGLRVVVPEDDEWPDYVLLRMHTAMARGVPGIAPPMMMWVRGQGRLDDLSGQAVAIVGTRAATPYGSYLAGEMAYGLAARGWTVVSGGAVGIDAAAHRGALAAGGRTIAVIAGGLDSPYPQRNAGLFQQIAGNGLLISEWPPGTAPQRHRFLLRNRLIAGLVAGSVVIEAGRRSGAKNTARHTRELGGTVMAVPGPVTSAMSVGCHQLVRECSARLVTSAAEVIEEIGRIGDDLALRPEAEPSVEDELDPAGRRVLDGLAVRRSSSPDQIAVATGVPVGVVLRHLPVLELLGLAESDSGGWKLASDAVRRLRRP